MRGELASSRARFRLFCGFDQRFGFIASRGQADAKAEVAEAAIILKLLLLLYNRLAGAGGRQGGGGGGGDYIKIIIIIV